MICVLRENPATVPGVIESAQTTPGAPSIRPELLGETDTREILRQKKSSSQSLSNTHGRKEESVWAKR